MNRILQMYFLSLMALLTACSPVPHFPMRNVDTQVKTGETGANSISSSTIYIPAADEKKEQVRTHKPTLEWLSPNGASGNINLVADKATIRIRISSAREVQLNQLDVLVDGVPPGNKADEVNLLRRPEFKDQIFTFQAPILTGRHQVQVVLALAADERYLVERTFIRDVTGVSLATSTPVSSLVRVNWSKPDAFVIQENEVFATKDRELEVRFNITSPNPVTLSQIRVLHNQVYKAPSPRAEFRGQNGNFSFMDWVTLDENATINDIGLRVDAAAGYALSRRLKVNYSPSRPNLYVLAIGPKLNLDYSDKDASDFAKAFSSQGSRAHRLFNQVTTDTLIGPQATAQAIRLAIASIRSKLRTGVILEDDIVILFFSTHGFILEKQLYLQAEDYLSYAATETSIPYRTGILQKIEDLPCRKLVLIDACHSAGAKANTTALNDAIKNLQEAPQGLAVFTSSSADEQSYEDARWENGAFTEAILKGLLEGRADISGNGNNNGIITLNELERYVRKTVPSLVKAVKQKRQHPELTRNELGDIPLFVRE